MIGNDCRCPGCGNCGAEIAVERLTKEREDLVKSLREARKSLREAKQKYAELSRMNESYIKNLQAAERERDEAYVKIQKLRAERRQLKHRVIECLKWVGVVPYPNTKGFSEMIAVRDLATDTLEEIKE